VSTGSRREEAARVSWRVALIDSCGGWPGALGAAAFISDGGQVVRREPGADPSGHGSRLAQLITARAGADASIDAKAVELLLAQVFLSAQPATGAAVAAAIDWAVAEGAGLIHMSLGLEADRTVLAEAVKRAVDQGCLIVASMPARGPPVYPANYQRVIRATGDARCAAGEISCLAPWFFGGCPHFEGQGQGQGQAAVGSDNRGGGGRGASVGAAWVTRSILGTGNLRGADEVVAALAAGAHYRGPERHGERAAE
jgi:hypothetical protein